MKLLLVALLLTSAVATAQPTPANGPQDAEPGAPVANTAEAALHRHVQAMEQLHADRFTLERFEREHLSEQYRAQTTEAERRAAYDRIRQAAAAAGGAMIDLRDGSYVLTLQSGDSATRVRFTLEQTPPFAIDALDVENVAMNPLALDWGGLPEQFATLAEEGFEGVVKVVRNGETVLERAYGRANPDLGVPMHIHTLFGIGSTPIDFTVAGLFALAQDGKLSLDDPVNHYLAGVPEDKSGITLRHILDSQTGLPDFHDQPGDWETDLAWIDREEAIRRIMAQPLLFPPGRGRAHSHSAYGLAAAVIEIVSGQNYFEFMDQRFFQPAGMTRTGMYGDHRGHALGEFAVGKSEMGVGLPNIPPNWGPTSWLVLGSGGMWSTLGDLRRFYDFVGTGGGLAEPHSAHFAGGRVVVGGSQRGFHIMEAQRDPQNWAMFITNRDGRDEQIRALERGLEALVME